MLTEPNEIHEVDYILLDDKHTILKSAYSHVNDHNSWFLVRYVEGRSQHRRKRGPFGEPCCRVMHAHMAYGLDLKHNM